MKILIVSQYFFPEDFKVNDVAFDLVKKGHDVTVFTAKPNYPKGKFYEGYSMFSKKVEMINGVKVIRTPIFPRKDGGKLFLSLNYLSFVFFSFLTIRFRVKGKYDIVFAHLTSPITAALPAIWINKRLKAPLVLWVLDLWPESVAATTNIKSSYIYNILNALVSYIYKKSDTILVSSRYFIQSIKEKIAGQNIDISYFPNWAEDIFISQNITNYTLPKLPEGFNIMFAGNIGDAQDFESIVLAAELTKKEEINWLIIGEGRKLDWLKKEKQDKGLFNLILLGRHPLETMPAFFKKANAMLVSLKDEPIFRLTVPAKIQAYMASGKIILGMINGEAYELINDSGCGFAVKAGDYESLVDKTMELKKMSKNQKEEMEKLASEFYVKHFTKEVLLEELTKIFINLKE